MQQSGTVSPCNELGNGAITRFHVDFAMVSQPTADNPRYDHAITKNSDGSHHADKRENG
jgi:hypothetical protein